MRVNADPSVLRRRLLRGWRCLVRRRCVLLLLRGLSLLLLLLVLLFMMVVRDHGASDDGSPSGAASDSHGWHLYLLPCWVLGLPVADCASSDLPYHRPGMSLPSGHCQARLELVVQSIGIEAVPSTDRDDPCPPRT